MLKRLVKGNGDPGIALFFDREIIKKIDDMFISYHPLTWSFGLYEKTQLLTIKIFWHNRRSKVVLAVSIIRAELLASSITYSQAWADIYEDFKRAHVIFNCNYKIGDRVNISSSATYLRPESYGEIRSIVVGPRGRFIYSVRLTDSLEYYAIEETDISAYLGPKGASDE